jgi:serine/threonine protein kinase
MITNEVNIWKQLSGHDNIVTLHAAGMNNQQVNIVNELCTEGTLFDLLVKYGGTLKEPQVIHILRDVCRGLLHMHQ